MESNNDNYQPLRREYARLAARYDDRWKHYVEASARETLLRLEVAPGERVLDVGCGTGRLLAALARAQPRARLAGVDLSDEMLSVARRRLGQTVELNTARAEALPFTDHSFEVAVSTSALHYMRRPASALAEMRRVLKSGGRVVITDWCGDYLTCRLTDRFLRLFNRAHFRVYRSGDLQGLLEQAGFSEIRVQRYRIDWWWGLMTATARKKLR